MSQIDVPTRDVPRGAKIISEHPFRAGDKGDRISINLGTYTKTFTKLEVGRTYDVWRTVDSDYVLVARPLNGIRRFMALLRV